MKMLSQNHVRYGLWMSLVTIVYLGLMELTGQNVAFDNTSPYQLIFMYLAPIIVWTIGMKSKKKELGNTITYKQALAEAFKISMVYAIVSPFVFMLYYLLVNPEILNYIRTAYKMTDASNTMVIGVDMVVQFIAAIVFGTIYGAIIALFVKTKT